MRRNYGVHTVKEISSTLNLSRNTVSKVLNGKPGVSARTRELILGYISGGTEARAAAPAAADAPQKTILFSYRLENIEYFNGLLSGVEKVIREHGYLLGVNIVNAGSSRPYFPPSVYGGSVCGILSFNIYDEDYWEEVLSLGIPAVFFDAIHDRLKFRGRADIVSVESQCPIHAVMDELYRLGRRRFAFFGDPRYCHSLNQRWLAFQDALREHALPLNLPQCILDDFSAFSDEECLQIVRSRLSAMRQLPDAFICASDRQAILLMRALKQLSVSVPEEIAVTGFDNLPESARQLPPLTTVECNSQYQGALAVRKLLERIADPGKPHEYIECETSLLLRESTGHGRSEG